MGWPFMDYHAKEELLMDEFLNANDNHELSVQVAGNGYHCLLLPTGTVLCIARSLEAVHKETGAYHSSALCRRWVY